MTGPGWLLVVFASAMLLTAGCCAARLVIWRVRARTTELEADALHVLMGVAMAGMFEPRLSPAPAAVWRAVFAAAAAWFTWQGIRGRRRSANWRCVHPAPHAVECAAMVYMLVPARAADHALAMTMRGMRTSGSALANPALALVLALFMAGYILWTSDQLASLSRDGAGASATLAPRFAAGYKIAMSVAMGYMLITMV